MGGDYLISRAKVDRWAKAILEEILPMPPESVGFTLQCMIDVYSCHWFRGTVLKRPLVLAGGRT
jgi:hypothetical protein